MKTLSSPLRSAAFLPAAVLSVWGPGAVWAQSLAEALDTPGVGWTAHGKVTAVSGPDLTWDGVDALRLEPAAALEPWEQSAVSTVLAQPSIVSFRHRSRDLDGTADFSVETGGYRDWSYRATFWRESPRLVAPPGELRIATSETAGGDPLFLDQVVITPAPVVSLAEALDAPGVVFTPDGAEDFAAGIRDAGLAPDGEDAVWFHGALSTVVPAAPGGLLVSHGGTADTRRDDDVRSDPTNPVSRKQFLTDPVGETVTWYPDGGGRILDRVSIAPPVPFAEALDAPGLRFEALPASVPWGRVSPPFGTADAPPGAKNGNAAVLPGPYDAPRLRVSGFSGPGVLRYAAISLNRFPPGPWEERRVAVPTGVTEYTFQESEWLDDVRFVPAAPVDPAALMGLPGADVAVLHPDRVAVSAGEREGEGTPPGLLLEAWSSGEEPPPDGLLRVRWEGPSLVSFSDDQGSRDAVTAADGTGIFYQDPLVSPTFRLFALVFPEPGGHEIIVRQPGLYHSLRVQPLVEVTLAEALDAPGMTFTTSPDTPWRGYVTGDLLGALGGRAACGGAHSAAGAGNPWVETIVNGPGVLRYDAFRTASGLENPLNRPAVMLTLDGVPVPRPPFDNEKSITVSIGAGTHTVRWTQSGADVLTNGKAELAWLDRVSFTPLTPEETPTLREALETGDRSWTTTGGPHAVAPVPDHGGNFGSYDGDCVHLYSTHGPAALSTVVERPFALRVVGKNVAVTVDGRPAAATPGEEDSSYYLPFHSITVREESGGPALVEISAAPGSVGIVDTVVVYSQAPAATAPGGSIGTDPSWTLRGNSMFWLKDPFDSLDEWGRGPVIPAPDPERGSNFAEAVIPGPFSFSGYAGLVLPDRGSRTAHRRVTYPGPNRVFLKPATDIFAPFPDAPLLELQKIWPGVSLGLATGAPDLVWTTGGDAPWMGETAPDGRPLYAVSGTLIPGEHSWIEATVQGPGVLRWTIPATTRHEVVHRVTVNGSVAAQPFTGGWLHLPPGPQRVRWWHSRLLGTTRPTDDARLGNVTFEPTPVPSFQEIAGIADMAFSFSGDLAPSPPWPGTPLGPWAELNAWTPLTVDGRSAALMRRSPPLPVFSSPGEYVVTSMTRPTDPLSTEQEDPGSERAAHPWLPKTFRAPGGVLPALNGLEAGRGLELLIDSAAWRPAAETGLAEALDTPGLEWTSGSNGFGDWRGYRYQSPGGAGEDDDFARCLPLTAGAEAWMETRVTGPARVAVTWDDGSDGKTASASLTGFQILVDGAEAAADFVRNTAFPSSGAEVSVPSGVHSLRLQWGPFFTEPCPAVISRVTVTPDTAPGVDIGALVEAPELPWHADGVTVSADDSGISWDEEDSARLVFPVYAPDPGALITTVTGPGVFRARVRGNPLVIAGGRPRAVGAGEGGQGFRTVEFALPDGRQVIRFQKKDSTTYHLDAVRWTPLPALPAAQALAAVGGSGGAGFAEGAVYAGYPGGGVPPQSVLIPEGPSGAARIRVPVPCRVTLSARALTASAAEPAAVLTLRPETVPLTTDAWKTVSLTTDELDAPDGWLTLESAGGAALIDDLVITPYDGNRYLPWIESAGLTGAAAALTADPDGDGLPNLLEHAFGLDPKKPDAGPSVPGLPEVFTTREAETGLTHLGVRFRGRHDADLSPAPVVYAVETGAGEPLRWTPAEGTLTHTPAANVPGRADFVWRSAAPVVPGGRLLVRVRVSAR